MTPTTNPSLMATWEAVWQARAALANSPTRRARRVYRQARRAYACAMQAAGWSEQAIRRDVS